MYRLLILLPFCLLILPVRHEAGAPWTPLDPSSKVQEPLPAPDGLTFLEKCVEHYRKQGIKTYSAILHKQERIGNKLNESEEIELYCREKPYSIFMRWLKGQRRAAAVLYVEGENNGMMLVHPAGVLGRLASVVARDPEGADAKEAGRYSVKEAGLQAALLRTIKDWKLAKEKGKLRVNYLGVRNVVEANGRDCYTLQRKLEPGEYDGILEVTVYIDKQTWQQIRTVLKGADNMLIADYIFRDIRINPQLKPNQFDRSALTQ